MRSSSPCALLLAVLIGLAPGARADTTVTVEGVGTRVGVIDTRVDTVTYSDPALVDVPGVGLVYEIEGIVAGIGWGGLSLRPGVANKHYAYRVPFVARWPRHGGGKTLVMYHHGGSGPTIAQLALLERNQGAQHVNRIAERIGDDSAGLATLVLKGTYIATNRRGLLGDGRFGATYLTSEVPPLTATEAATLAVPHPDIQAGLPVPVGISLDTATARDVARALQIVVADVSKRRFRERIFLGTSAGAIVGSGMAFGCNVISGACMRTGGNHVVPYDRSTPLLFDGFLLTGFPYSLVAAGTPEPWIADPEQPLAAPVFFLQGRADERYQHPIRMAHDLVRRGVELDGSVWIYEYANQPHVTRDTGRNVPPIARHAEPGGPYMAAALRNMRELIAGDSTPPPSRIAGRILDGGLVFDVENGPTREMPVREDALHDAVTSSPMLVVRRVDEGPFDSGATARWLEVTAALPHVAEPIVGPSIACRIGYYDTQFFGSLFTPDAALLEEQGSFSSYRECVRDVVSELTAEDLYDPRVERPDHTAELYRSLFSEP